MWKKSIFRYRNWRIIISIIILPPVSIIMIDLKN